MPVLRPSSSDFTSFVKAAAQYVAPGRTAKVSKSGGVSVALPGLGAIIRTSLVGALASPSTSALIMDGATSSPAAAVIRVLLGIVTTLAGSASGFADGTTEARFTNPYSVAVIPSSGVIVVGDTGNHTIRLVTPGGVVTTLAGTAGAAAFADGTTAARFNGPQGVAVTSTGDIVVADASNNRIRLVTPGGVVTTLAGQTTAGTANGAGAAASFWNPSGVAVLPNGNIVVADGNNHLIRLVTPLGVVSTLAGSGPSGTFADGTGAAARFNNPYGIAVIPSSGVIVVSDTNNHRIRIVTPLGVVTTLAGSSIGYADGTGAGARFSGPTGVAVTSTGDIVVADAGNHRIRLVTYPGGVVTTLAGSIQSFLNGTGAGARFNSPTGVAVTPTGDVVVADYVNNRIRLIV